MKITVDSRMPADASADLLAIPMGPLGRGKRLPPPIAAVDRACRGAISAALEAGDFAGKPAQSSLLYAAGKRKAKRILLLGTGKDGPDLEGLRKLAGRAVGEAARRRASKVALVAPRTTLDGATAVQALAEGAVLAGYRLDEFRSEKRDDGSVGAVSLLIERGGDLRGARAGARRGAALAESQNVARRLSDMPPNELAPADLARESRAVAREVGLKVKVLDEKALARLDMGAILAVGAGSAHPPRLIVLEHRPKSKKADGQPPFVIVGKGITFDSGGISIKPSAGMDEMKHDMSGAAAVVGTLRACAALDLPYPVVGVIGAAENMPSGTAYRPGDVVRAMSGKMIEVLNTDAEGRVVLADALHYARTEFEPCAIVNLATLTGATMVALGRWATGVFGNHPGLIEQIRSAGETTAERMWPMPLLDEHKEEIRSQIADIKNTGGRQAGASTAAAFLWNFVGDTPWAHLDIAGTGWVSATHPYQRRGATGVGVRMLLELLREWDPAQLEA
jgi:leucyl aminopeptidase